MSISSGTWRHPQDPKIQTPYHKLGRQSKFPNLGYKVNSFASEPHFSTTGGRGKKKRKTSQILDDPSKKAECREEKLGKN